MPTGVQEYFKKNPLPLERPHHISERSWSLLTAHVVDNVRYIDLAKTHEVTPTRIREIVRSAKRKLSQGEPGTVSTYVRHALAEAGVSLEDAKGMSKAELEQIPRIGKAAIREIQRL